VAKTKVFYLNSNNLMLYFRPKLNLVFDVRPTACKRDNATTVRLSVGLYVRLSVTLECSVKND